MIYRTYIARTRLPDRGSPHEYKYHSQCRGHMDHMPVRKDCIPVRTVHKWRVHKDCNWKPKQASYKLSGQHLWNGSWERGNRCGTNLKYFRHWKNNRYSQRKAIEQQSKITQTFSWFNLLDRGGRSSSLDFSNVLPNPLRSAETLYSMIRKRQTTRRKIEMFSGFPRA